MRIGEGNSLIHSAKKLPFMFSLKSYLVPLFFNYICLFAKIPAKNMPCDIEFRYKYIKFRYKMPLITK